MKHFSWSHNGTFEWHILFLVVVVTIYLVFSESVTVISQASERRQIQEPPVDFTSFSLEELKQVMIISILKKPQKLSEATSAISVITQNDIRRSGATNIPELLRCVPGFQVAQINSNTWAVSSRGFNHRFANKLLVLMDGRSLYTPLFSGVYWNVQDTLFEDIERIEVIRGPGATLWGANAVNGVINIITKKAQDTQGGLIISGWGDEERGFNAFRYGSKFSDNAYGRFYIKYFNRDSFVNESGGKWNDNWDSLRGGGRIDWSVSDSDSLTIQGDIYEGRSGERMEIIFETEPYLVKMRIDTDYIFSGGNLLCRWKHTFSETSDMALRLYYDKTKQDQNNSDNTHYSEKFDIFDVDFQHGFKLSMHQEIVWGVGYRFIRDHFKARADRPVFLLDPDSRDTHIVSSFIQDGIDLFKERVRLTLGSKFENNDYTGSEIQPSIRLLWKPTKTQNVWSAFSRAFRTPSRYEYDDVTPISDSFSIDPYPVPSPEHDIESEELTAYEFGYRIQPTDYFSLDLALFYNEYDNLILFRDNIAEADTYGMELATNWDVSKWWHLSASYTYLRMHIRIDENVESPPDFLLKGGNPHDQFIMLSSMELSHNLELDLAFRYVDNLYNYIGSYMEMDARLGWIPNKNLEVSLAGRNLLHSHHPEFLSLGHLPYSKGENVEVERSIYGKIICRF